MTIVATYKGENRTMDYNWQKDYVLKLDETQQGITISRQDGTSPSTYASLTAFFESWEGVSMIDNN